MKLPWQTTNLKHSFPGEPAEGGELQDHGAGAGGAGVRLGARARQGADHAMLEVHLGAQWGGVTAEFTAVKRKDLLCYDCFTL